VTSERSITGTGNYFDDFTVGSLFRHQRGKTITEFDNVVLTHLVMNTAEGHFNEDVMSRSEFGSRITFGGIVAAVVLGLASQDTAEQAVAELGIDKMRFVAPVFHGDTIYAYSQVVEKSDVQARDGMRVGEIRFRHWGVNQREDVVADIERRAVLRCSDSVRGGEP
jgi:itaconyl-CoA hydratase